MATKTQTKTTTVSALASKIKVDNILQLTLVQSTLEANFKAILEALSDHDNDFLKLKQDSKNNQGALKNLQVSQDTMGKQIHDLKEIVNKLSKQNLSIKSQIASNDKKSNAPPNPQAAESKNSLLQQINKELSAIRQKENQLENNLLKATESTRAQIEKIRKDLSELNKISEANRKNEDASSKLRQIQKALKEMDGKNKQIMSKIKQIESEVSNNNDKKDELSEISKLVQDMNQKIGEFSNEQYKKNNRQIIQRLNKVQKQSEQNKAAVDEEKRLRGKLNQQLWKVHDAVSKVSENNFSQEMTNDSLKQLKRELAELQKKVNEAGINGSNKHGFNDTTAYTHLHESPSKFKISEADSPNKAQIAANNADLRQEMLERLKNLKSDLIKYIKKLDFKNEGDNVFDKKRLDSIDEAILRLDHLISQKAGTDSVKKLIDHIENKVSYIYNVFFGSETQEDACIARKNWVCLSCDKNLEKYQGRLGHHLANDKLRVKNLEQETIGGGMTLRPSKSKVDLPNVYNKIVKKI